MAGGLPRVSRWRGCVLSRHDHRHVSLQKKDSLSQHNVISVRHHDSGTVTRLELLVAASSAFLLCITRSTTIDFLGLLCGGMIDLRSQQDRCVPGTRLLVEERILANSRPWTVTNLSRVSPSASGSVEANGSGSSFPYAALAGGLAAAVALVASGGWYVRRRFRQKRLQ